MHILVADDDIEDQFIIKASFEEIQMSHLLHFVEDGQKAVSYLQSVAKDNLPSLIMLDLNMPLMNGKEALKYIKGEKTLAHIPVVVFSTSVSDADHKLCIEYGASEYITKPMNYEEYVAVARQMAARCGFIQA